MGKKGGLKKTMFYKNHKNCPNCGGDFKNNNDNYIGADGWKMWELFRCKNCGYIIKQFPPPSYRFHRIDGVIKLSNILKEFKELDDTSIFSMNKYFANYISENIELCVIRDTPKMGWIFSIILSCEKEFCFEKLNKIERLLMQAMIEKTPIVIDVDNNASEVGDKVIYLGNDLDMLVKVQNILKRGEIKKMNNYKNHEKCPNCRCDLRNNNDNYVDADGWATWELFRCKSCGYVFKRFPNKTNSEAVKLSNILQKFRESDKECRCAFNRKGRFINCRLGDMSFTVLCGDVSTGQIIHLFLNCKKRFCFEDLNCFERLVWEAKMNDTPIIIDIEIEAFDKKINDVELYRIDDAFCKKVEKGQKKIVYVCSPFKGDVKANTLFARCCCKYAISQGVIPIAPHLLFPQFLNDENPEERKLAMDMNMVFLEKCDELWVFGDKISMGMHEEMRQAIKLKKEIRYFQKIEVFKEDYMRFGRDLWKN